jgi:hypothetical protein
VTLLVLLVTWHDMCERGSTLETGALHFCCGRKRGLGERLEWALPYWKLVSRWIECWSTSWPGLSSWAILREPVRTGTFPPSQRGARDKKVFPGRYLGLVRSGPGTLTLTPCSHSPSTANLFLHTCMLTGGTVYPGPDVWERRWRKDCRGLG